MRRSIPLRAASAGFNDRLPHGESTRLVASVNPGLLPYLVDQRAGRAPRNMREDREATAVFLNDLSFGWEGGASRVTRVIATFDIHGRADAFDQQLGCILVEDGEEVNASQGGQNLGALRFWCIGTCRALESAYRGVAVEAHGESVTQSACRLEISNVTHV